MMKKFLLLLSGLLLLLAAGCGANNDNVNDNVDEDRTITADSFSYVLPAGWVKSEEYSTEKKVFYVLSGHEQDEKPDNISVEIGTNRYAADEHMRFREAIVSQLARQLQGIPGMLTGDGTFTDNEDVLYIFTFVEEVLGEDGISDFHADDEQRFAGVTSRQYYIVGEKRYGMVYLTNFSGSEEVTAAADKLAKSFVWLDEE